MSHEWTRLEKRNWPDGSLERHLKLNHPGCKSAVEAVKRVISSKNDTASQAPEKQEPLSDVETMRKVIASIENLINGFDIDLLNEKTRSSLTAMPLTNAQEVSAWEKAWLKVLGADKTKEQLSCQLPLPKP